MKTGQGPEFFCVARYKFTFTNLVLVARKLAFFVTSPPSQKELSGVACLPFRPRRQFMSFFCPIHL